MNYTTDDGRYSLIENAQYKQQSFDSQNASVVVVATREGR